MSETGGLRRVYLRGHTNTLKRVLIHVPALNLGLVVHKPAVTARRGALQGRLRRLLAALFTALQAHRRSEGRFAGTRLYVLTVAWLASRDWIGLRGQKQLAFTTGC